MRRVLSRVHTIIPENNRLPYEIDRSYPNYSENARSYTITSENNRLPHEIVRSQTNYSENSRIYTIISELSYLEANSFPVMCSIVAKLKVRFYWWIISPLGLLFPFCRKNIILRKFPMTYRRATTSNISINRASFHILKSILDRKIFFSYCKSGISANIRKI